MLDVVKFIVYWSTSNAESALKAVRSGEAAKVRVALRLSRRGASVRHGGVLYAIAERAQWLEQMGVDRRVATEQLAAEFLMRLEDRLRRIREAYNSVVFSASLVFLAAIVIMILGILSPIALNMASALVLTSAVLGVLVEGLVPPVRRWDYRVTAAAMIPAVAALAWRPAVYLTMPTAVIYGLWYFRLRREAEEEFKAAIRGKLQAASTDLAKEALDVVRAVRQSGAYYLQATAEYLLGTVEQYYSSIRQDGLIRALIILSMVFIAAAAIAQMYQPLMEMVAKVQLTGGVFPIQLYKFDPKPVIMALGLVAAVLAGRVAESYAMSPIFTPVMLVALAL